MWWNKLPVYYICAVTVRLGQEGRIRIAYYELEVTNSVDTCGICWQKAELSAGNTRRHLRRSLIQTNDMFAFLSLQLFLSSLPSIRLSIRTSHEQQRQNRK
jgi:hypothetical protein